VALNIIPLFKPGFLVKWVPQITSIVLNPVICSAKGCAVADARMMLMSKNHMKSST
jgi:hypothetical protein